ncbi:FkbM family methyltransferase [Chitinophagaceae bacterium 26-R-25]|nr:FkbM family methyltransferase [Chitinophagaceae bacterium 26-R-25]
MQNLFRKIINKIVLPNSQLTYSQSGEDLILATLFYKKGITNPTYLDIGANHPTYISNTYYFYMRGSKGVCIEPNPYLAKKIKSKRPKDKVLNIGIGINEAKEADFYLFPYKAHGLSTFSKEEAEYWKEVGMKNVGKVAYEKVIKVPLNTINNIIKTEFSSVPDFVSIDVEGLDLEILKTLDFSLYRPKVICVEILGYDKDQNEFKKTEIQDFLESKNYYLYADTHINGIFLSKDF